MPRIAEDRPPAQPSSEEQKARYRRMLRACARLAAQHGLERMQMQDVAKEAGVAIGTLYRYFPSKIDLLVAVLQAQVEVMSSDVRPPAPGTPPSESVAEVLIRATRSLLEHPRLAMALLQANNTAQLKIGREHTSVTSLFQSVLLSALGIGAPDDQDLRMVRLVEQTYYGVLISVLNGHITEEEALGDIRMAGNLLLSPTYDR